MPLDSINMGTVAVLPEIPTALVFRLFYIVVGYPIRIFVKVGRIEILSAETARSIEYRSDSIMIFHIVHPHLNGLLQAFGREVTSLLHIEYGHKVVVLQLNHSAIIHCLPARVRRWIEEVVGSAEYSLMTSLEEILIEEFIKHIRALRCLHDDESNRYTSDGGACHLVPVYLALIVGNVYASDIAFRIDYITEACTYLKRIFIDEYLSCKEEEYCRNGNEREPEEVLAYMQFFDECRPPTFLARLTFLFGCRTLWFRQCRRRGGLRHCRFRPPRCIAFRLVGLLLCCLSVTYLVQVSK